MRTEKEFIEGPAACPADPAAPRAEAQVSHPADETAVRPAPEDVSAACFADGTAVCPGSGMPAPGSAADGAPRDGARAPELLTPRLRLRAFAAEDAEALYACCRNPRLGDDAGWKPHESLEESRQVLREVFLEQPATWAVAERETGRLIGAVALMPDPRRDEPGVRMLGYWLDEAQWGRGAMNEACRRVLEYAFATLGCETVTATCYPHNLRSKRLIERLGFRFEKVLPRAMRDHRGLVFDLLSYHLSREVWHRLP